MGLEPTAFCATNRRSNQLSYTRHRVIKQLKLYHLTVYKASIMDYSKYNRKKVKRVTEKLFVFLVIA